MRAEQRTTFLTFLLPPSQTYAVCGAEVFNHIPIFVLRTAVAWLHAPKNDVVEPIGGVFEDGIEGFCGRTGRILSEHAVDQELDDGCVEIVHFTTIVERHLFMRAEQRTAFLTFLLPPSQTC